MRYPGYLLNPGDLFQVDPERVMYATGAPKDKRERRESRLAKKAAAAAARQAEAEKKEGEEAEEKKEQEGEKSDTEADGKVENPRETLKYLLAQAKTIMSDSKDVLPAKKKQELRGFQKAVRRVLSRSDSSSVLADNLEEQFSELIKVLKVKRAEKKEGKDAQGAEQSKPEQSPASEPSKQTESTEPATAEITATSTSEGKPSAQLTEAFKKAAENPEALDDETISELSDFELDVLKRALEQMRDNPVDSTKPYATPWRPRDYMSAFAFIPRYLEVNQNICAAVYLRHPVCRPGYSEVPTPFNESIGTAAFAYYLRRR